MARDLASLVAATPELAAMPATSAKAVPATASAPAQTVPVPPGAIPNPVASRQYIRARASREHILARFAPQPVGVVATELRPVTSVRPADPAGGEWHI